MGKEIHKKHTFMVQKGSSHLFFSLLMMLLLIFFAGGDGGYFHIMEDLLILHVA
jgi:hypothetical protein